MFFRITSAVLVFGGLVLCGLAAWSYFAPPAGPDLAVAEPTIKLDDAIAGKETAVVFHLQNNSGRPIRVLGQVFC